MWNLEKKYDNAGPGGVPLFLIRNVMDSHCLDLPDYGARPGTTHVQESTCNSRAVDKQLWWLDKQAEGKFWIRNFASDNQCLDSYGRDHDVRNLIAWPCTSENQNNHQWIVTPS